MSDTWFEVFRTVGFLLVLIVILVGDRAFSLFKRLTTKEYLIFLGTNITGIMTLWHIEELVPKLQNILYGIADDRVKVMSIVFLFLGIYYLYLLNYFISLNLNQNKTYRKGV